MRRHCAPTFVLLASVLIAADVRGGESDQQVLAKKAQSILKANCHRCHGQDGVNEGGFNFVADLGQLVKRRRVIPGDPAKSKIMRRIIDADDPMPPAEEKTRPDAADIAFLQKWIKAGAPTVGEAVKHSFLTPADMLGAMRDDLNTAKPRERLFLRYFTLTHLYNAGLSAEELQSYRNALSKLVNSLSWGKNIVVPKVVDAEGAILRVDLRDYQWNEKTWEAIVARDPYGIQVDAAAARACAEETGCKVPHVRADWFVASASRPPLYHDILQLPGSESELEKMLRVDVLENIRQERVIRAGFNGSGVSRNNRLIERHESGGTVYWKSYDFAGNIGRQNLFAHPLGPNDGETGFLHDGGEIIFTLPNGLQAYLLVDAGGRRIDKGPTAIVSDPRRPDRAVENGLSCIACHARGIIDKVDQVRGHVLKNPRAFSHSELETIQSLYPTPERLAALMRSDAKRFQEAVSKTGAPLSTTEPIAALAARFETELDLSLAAAEAAVIPSDLLQALDRFPHLAKVLGPLRVEGGTVQRQVYVDHFQDLALALHQGTNLTSANAVADKLLRLGISLLAKDTAAALRAFSQALEIDPRSAHLFNQRGLAFHRLGDHDKALADFSAALRLEPRFAAAYHNRGAAYYAKGDLEYAIADYDEALNLNDQAPLVYNNRGFAFFDKGQHDRAIADFDQALRLDPKFAAAFNNRGLAYLRQNKLDQALADFSVAINLKPDFALAYLHRSLVYSRLGNTARAETDRKKALHLDPALD